MRRALCACAAAGAGLATAGGRWLATRGCSPRPRGMISCVSCSTVMVVSPLLLGVVARVVGPLLGIFAISYVAQYRVFGPVTEQQFVENGLPYDATWWSVVFFVSCGAAIWHLPMQHELPRTLHRFYARSLRRAFFALFLRRHPAFRHAKFTENPCHRTIGCLPLIFINCAGEESLNIGALWCDTAANHLRN